MFLVEILAHLVVYSFRRLTALTALPLVVLLAMNTDRVDVVELVMMAFYWVANASLTGLLFNGRVSEKGRRPLRHWFELVVAVVFTTVVVVGIHRLLVWEAFYAAVPEAVQFAVGVGWGMFAFFGVFFVYGLIYSAENYDASQGNWQDLKKILNPAG